MIKFATKMLSTVFCEVILPRRDFRGEFLGFAIVPSSVWQKILLVEGTCLVISELVIIHNKFMEVR